MKQLEKTLSWSLHGKVRRSDEMQVKRGRWRPYLHLEHGKIWTASDACEWEELIVDIDKKEGVHILAQPEHLF